jgi:hypothetical protein
VDPQPTPDDAPAAEPSAQAVFRYMMYGASLPERALRAATAVVSGAVRESAALLVPQAFRSSRSYTMFVEQMLDFLAHDVGGVERPQAAETAEVQGFVARKTVGSFLELAGLATLHVSPLTVLAILSDVAYGSREFLCELSHELKQRGIIDPDSSIDQTSDLLAAISKASGDTASVFDMPPISVDGVKQTLEQTREAIKGIDVKKAIPQAELRRLWQELHDVAKKENVSILDLSTTISLYTMQRLGTVGQGALSTVRVAGNMFDRHILEHYSRGLEEVRRKGFYATLSDASRPYISAVWRNFSNEKPTVTEDLLTGKMIGRVWAGVRSWWSVDASRLPPPDVEADEPDPPLSA